LTVTDRELSRPAAPRLNVALPPLSTEEPGPLYAEPLADDDSLESGAFGEWLETKSSTPATGSVTVHH
jgi:hypothetical protein